MARNIWWGRRLLVVALALGWLAASPLAPAGAVTCEVISIADSGTGTLREKLADASCNGITFALPGAAPWTIALASELPLVQRAVTITGPGAASLTIRGNNTFRLLPVDLRGAPHTPVAIGGLTLSGGHASASGAIHDYGGNLLSFGADLTLTDVALTDGTAAPGFGGAGAAMSGGTNTLTRVTISGNVAPGSITYGTGAGLYIDEGVTDARVAIVNSAIVGNTATDNGGGGIAISRNSGVAGRTLDVTLINTTVGTPASPNRATLGKGGGLNNARGNLTLTNSVVSGNTAPDAGGISHYRGTLTLTNVTISGNRATLGGGGLVNINGTATLTNATITGNSGPDGGGILTTGGPGNLVTTRLGHSIVAGNTGPGGDCAVNSASYASYASDGHNVVGAGCPATGPGDATVASIATVLDPTLADNGGPTKTHTLVAGSPAIDRLPVVGCPVAADQRGVARPNGAGCDSGAVEHFPPVALTVVAVGDGTVGRNPVGTGTGPYAYPLGSVVMLTPQPGGGQAFVGWVVDGAYRGWAAPLTLTLGADHTAQATFAPPAGFPDFGGGRADHAAIVALATRGTIRGYADGRYGPGDGVQRAQMAALIARAMPAGPGSPPSTLVPPACLAAGSWDCEDWGNTFSDRNGLDGNLWRNVGALQFHDVARGYDGAACAARGVGSPCFAPTAPVSYIETVTFITRALVTKGYWMPQPGATQPYAGVPAVFSPEVATFHFYTGGIPAPPADWNAGATRGWFAMALWAALDSYWGTYGTLPDGRPAGSHVP